MNWDYLILGSGITGLAFGSLVAQEHKLKVLVVEKHKVPGGYASEFKRKKNSFRFECSLHKVSGIGDKGNLKRILSRLGIYETLEWIYPRTFFKAMLPDDQCATGHKSIQLSNEVDQHIDSLVAAFPAEAVAIREYFSHIMEHGQWGYYQFQMMSGEYDVDFKTVREGKKRFSNVTIAEQLNKMFESDYLKAILAAPAIYVGAHPEQASYLYFLHVVFATLVAGNAYIRGGGQQLSNALVDTIQRHSGELSLANPVEKVEIDNKSFTAVKTRLGMLSAKNLVINASPHYAMQKLVPSSPELETVNDKLNQLQAANSTTTLYLAMRNPPAHYGLDCSETMIFSAGMNLSISSRNLSHVSEQHAEQAFWQKGTMEVTNYHALDTECGYVIVANVLDNADHWPQRQSKEYREKKDRARSVLFARLCQYFSLTSEDVLWQEVSTPHTYERYTNNHHGSGYGALVSPGNSGHTFHYAFPYKNISFMSSWTAGSGYEAAFSYAEYLANNLKASA